MSGDIERRIRERAYEIWESEGRPNSRSDEHWRQARAEFEEASMQAEPAPVAAATPEVGEAGSAERGSPAASAAAKPRAGGRSAAAKAAVPPRRKKTDA